MESTTLSAHTKLGEITLKHSPILCNSQLSPKNKHGTSSAFTTRRKQCVHVTAWVMPAQSWSVLVTSLGKSFSQSQHHFYCATHWYGLNHTCPEHITKSSTTFCLVRRGLISESWHRPSLNEDIRNHARVPCSLRGQAAVWVVKQSVDCRHWCNTQPLPHGRCKVLLMLALQHMYLACGMNTRGIIATTASAYFCKRWQSNQPMAMLGKSDVECITA